MPPPIEEPTLGEVLRRIDSLTVQVTNLVAELKEDRLAAAKTYMRQDVYLVERQAIEANLSDVRADLAHLASTTDTQFSTIEKRHRADDDKRRQMWATIGGLTLGFLSLLTTVIIAFIK
ncbi:hypothetical protein [Nocardioides sp. T2.26MG-1]|uniref:hypothetical protein n=1 Tax=Nocardioides sp. T2.26MG-1 TaxID=3041166 RepID=UPI002477917E|nr:hypothetical protein [Nocardioides sp. T2.26MG-1]CAI9417412.1 hypothetical protein HIDPHFAB_03013 [Nocardioides sp. T2.26MG-1]